jgi:hypothetical protein
VTNAVVKSTQLKLSTGVERLATIAFVLIVPLAPMATYLARPILSPTTTFWQHRKALNTAKHRLVTIVRAKSCRNEGIGAAIAIVATTLVTIV